MPSFSVWRCRVDEIAIVKIDNLVTGELPPVGLETLQLNMQVTQFPAVSVGSILTSSRNRVNGPPAEIQEIWQED
jgi:hypothetical protein